MARRLPFTLATRSVPRIVIRPENTAILIQDMQRYFAHPDGGYNQVARARGVDLEFEDYYAQMPAVISNIQRLISMARQFDMPVFFTRFAYDDKSDVSLLQKSLGIVISSADCEAEIVEPLDLGPNDPVLTKTGFSAFSNPTLESELRIRQIENLVLTDVMTEFGIRSTALSALDHGFRPIIVSDGCAGITRETHGLTTSEMTYAMMKVRNTGEILRYVKGLEFDDVVLI